MRSFAIYGATLAVVGVLGAGLGACSDGGAGIPTGTGGTVGTGDTGSTTGGMVTTTGGGTVVPNAGSGTQPTAGSSSTPTGGTGSDPGTGGTTADPGTGGVAPTAGSAPVGGSAPIAGSTGTGGSTSTGGLRTGSFKMLMMSNALEYAHPSIADCTKMLKELGAASAPERATITGLAADATWTVDETNPKGDLSEVTAENLQAHEMFYSNNPTGKVFTNSPNGAMKKQFFQTFMD
ncbi:MAG: hypothetical protein ABUL60_08970, partial [Myxococcales bacterium]